MNRSAITGTPKNAYLIGNFNIDININTTATNKRTIDIKRAVVKPYAFTRIEIANNCIASTGINKSAPRFLNNVCISKTHRIIMQMNQTNLTYQLAYSSLREFLKYINIRLQSIANIEKIKLYE